MNRLSPNQSSMSFSCKIISFCTVVIQRVERQNAIDRPLFCGICCHLCALAVSFGGCIFVMFQVSPRIRLLPEAASSHKHFNAALNLEEPVSIRAKFIDTVQEGENKGKEFCVPNSNEVRNSTNERSFTCDDNQGSW